MANNKILLRKVHRLLAPVMLLPLVVTLTTGSLYQVASLTGKGGDFYWLIQIHKGDWIILNLEVIYPFLNAFGLLVMIGTGINMWLQMQRPKQSRGGT